MKYITVSVETAAKATNHMPGDLNWYTQLMLVRLKREYRAQFPNLDENLCYAFATAALFNAGRMQGIREERARRTARRRRKTA